MELELPQRFRVRCEIFWYAPEGFSSSSRHSEACEVFQMAMVVKLVLPHRFRMRAFFLVRTGKIFHRPEVLGSVRGF